MGKAKKLNRWRPQGDLTIFDVGELEKVCPALKSQEQDCLFDLEAVQEVDAAGIQWLMSVEQRLASRKLRLLLDNIPEPVTTALEMMGLAGRFQSLTEHGEAKDDRSG